MKKFYNEAASWLNEKKQREGFGAQAVEGFRRIKNQLSSIEDELNLIKESLVNITNDKTGAAHAYDIPSLKQLKDIDAIIDITKKAKYTSNIQRRINEIEELIAAKK